MLNIAKNMQRFFSTTETMYCTQKLEFCWKGINENYQQVVSVYAIAISVK